MAMRFGVSLPNGHHPAELVRFAVELEQAGWDGFFLWDHVQLDPGRREPTYDPWVQLGAIGAHTERLRLGTLVTPVPRRRPWKLAKEVVTLDHLTGGRAVLGVGLGVPPATEYGAFGEPVEPKLHAARLDEALPVLDRLLRGEPVDHRGEHYQVSAELLPGSVQRPRPPIWVAAMLPARAGVRRAARWDGIVPQSRDTGPLTPEALAALVAELPERSLSLSKGKPDDHADPSFDVVTPLADHAPADELADAGATWGIDGPRHREETFAETRARLLAGPPR